MLALNHWYYRYPHNLRRAYYSMLILCWAIIFMIFGMGKISQIRAARRAAMEASEATIIMPMDTIRYSEMAPPPSLSSDNFAAEAALPDVAPAAVEDVTSSVPLPVPDEQAEASTMATAKTIAGVAAPAASGTGAPIFIVAETTKVYDDNKPAPVTFTYMKASIMPSPLKDVQPEYPDKARALSIEGTAMVDMWLRKDGTVSIVSIYKSSGNALLDTAAAKAAAKSTFTPAKGADGNPVNVWVRRPFRFSLTGGR
jgi:protein TonB